ncbi:hepatitis A virus cellular receptor 1 homolog isoform X2 [Anguilla anguilla]|uniref:hepatitis A virus cellular receptor 1 homolog isoform X2 n=1 Tax=Anguilla anguilla TaxID=7936 RepID=UPI0015B176F9|nr:hepatitis A virus cellular receptor 1 homolog isoform X2 [Anguilla anguilla]
MRRLCAVFYCTTLSVLSVCVGSMLTLIGKTGESVTLPCRYDIIANGLTEMCWGRGEVPTSKCSNTIVSTDGEKVTFSESDRYRLQSGVQEGNVSLTIINVTENDSGIYGCRVEISGWFNDLKLNFYLITVKGEGTTPPADTGNSDIPVLVSVQDQEISQRFSGNVIRIGAAIFIPGLIIIVILELRSRQEKRRRSAEQLDHSAPTVQIRN